MKNLLAFIIIFICFVSSAFAQTETQNQSKSAPLIDQLSGWIKKNNPLDKNNNNNSEKKVKSPDPETISEPTEDSKTEKTILTSKEPEDFSLNQNRLHFSIGLGNLGLEANSGSVLDKNYSQSAGVLLGLTYENPISENGSFETGLAFLFLSSKLKNTSNTDMNLSYLAVPIIYKHIVSQVHKQSSFYFKGGLIPLILLDASVDTCDSIACGADSDLDAWLTKSRSISDSFQKYSVLGAVGIGFNFHVFNDLIFKTVWINTDLSYIQGLSSINRGKELGNEVKIQGAQMTLGLAATF